MVILNLDGFHIWRGVADPLAMPFLFVVALVGLFVLLGTKWLNGKSGRKQ